MELSSCVVRHAGNLGMTIHKETMPPAELVLLRSIHGMDAVVQIHVTKEGKRDNRKEVERLRGLYGETAFEKCFPGQTPQLPVTLAEAGLLQSAPVDDDLEETPESAGDVPVSDRTMAPPAAAIDRLKRRTGAPGDLVG